MEWISWNEHPVPNDVKGILIKYEDGVFGDRYDLETGERKYRDSKIVGWKFMVRRDLTKKTLQC
jgi:hypothetical protein